MEKDFLSPFMLIRHCTRKFHSVQVAFDLGAPFTVVICVLRRERRITFSIWGVIRRGFMVTEVSFISQPRYWQGVSNNFSHDALFSHYILPRLFFQILIVFTAATLLLLSTSCFCHCCFFSPFFLPSALIFLLRNFHSISPLLRGFCLWFLYLYIFPSALKFPRLLLHSFMKKALY